MYLHRVCQIVKGKMNKKITKMIDDTIFNLAKARESNDPELVQAVLINLQSVLPSYINALELVSA
jgi:flagellar biosynthesis/type III secretory pathway protein FliH